VRGAQAVASVLMDRLQGIVSILIMATVGVFLVRGLIGNKSLVACLALAAAVCAVAVAAIFSEWVASICHAITAWIPIPRLRRVGTELIAAVRSFAPFHRQLATVLLLSIAVQVLRIIQAFCLGRALGIGLPLIPYFALIPAILLIMLLPITVS